MLRANKRTGEVSGKHQQTGKNLYLATILAAFMALGIVAVVASRVQTADAYSGAANASDKWMRSAEQEAPARSVDCEDLWARSMASNSIGALSQTTAAAPMDHDPITRTDAEEHASATVYVWAARLTVGEVSDSTVTYLGYMPGVASPGQQGSLQTTMFTYGGVEYTIQALFLQRTTGGIQTLVLQADQPLPDHLILHIGKERFFVAESELLEGAPSVHTWRLDQDLGWFKGQTTYAALLEPTAGQIEHILICRAGPNDLLETNS